MAAASVLNGEKSAMQKQRRHLPTLVPCNDATNLLWVYKSRVTIDMVRQQQLHCAEKESSNYRDAVREGYGHNPK